ncbi:hypothetical protein ACIQVC_37235 [Streptomyces sp. NPDC101112]|uniref:hypothetical protein n=1 Tax=Streptomyces sp. NPDC101112 TaxID=3366105 RepID=UPI0038251EDA
MHSTYRKKPIPVQARRLTSESYRALIDALTAEQFVAGGEAADGGVFLEIRTLEGQLRAREGDWIVWGTHGDVWPVRGDIFAETYEPISEQPPTDRAALRDRIAAALYERERPPRDPHWPDAYAADREVFEPMADAVLAVLSEPADAPAAECSAQHRTFDDGRLCIRAAQHHGDHIDERGFHWSDTVAVYPVADGTFRQGTNAQGVLRRLAAEVQPGIAHAERRDRLAAGIYEYWNPGRSWADAHPDDIAGCRADADAAMTVADAVDGHGAAARTTSDTYREVADRLAQFAQKNAPGWARYCGLAALKVNEWAAQMIRPRTPDRVRTAGGGRTVTTITLQRHCPAGHRLGDATQGEVLAASDGRPLPDARAECSACQQEASVEEQPVERPRCPLCQMPHDLKPGSLPVAACESIRHRIAEAERLHGEGDHSFCARVDCDVLRERDAAEARQDGAPIVAYRFDGGRLLNCLRHVPPPAARHADCRPVTAEDLPDGGVCTYPECGVDVLIPQDGAQPS